MIWSLLVIFLVIFLGAHFVRSFILQSGSVLTLSSPRTTSLKTENGTSNYFTIAKIKILFLLENAKNNSIILVISIQRIGH